MTECKTKSPDCKNEAIIRSFWPGKPPMNVCGQCAQVQQKIAGVMGFFLHQEELPVVSYMASAPRVAMR